MYRPFFQLTDLPFRSTPDLDYFYKDADRDEVVNALLYALDRGDGIVKVIGEVGSGKTTILRRLSQSLPLDYSIVYINSPNLSAHDILFFICVEFGLDVQQNEQKFFLTKKLQEFLLGQHANGRHPLLLIDEAQAMPIETLEEMRLLTNLETEQDKLLQIVLFGQPELDQNLLKPEIRQFLSRISHSIKLPAFSKEDVQSYLNFRMRKAGYQGKDLFTRPIASLIHRLSKGLPREIHSLADKMLLNAFVDNSYALKKKYLQPNVSNWRKFFIISFLVIVFVSAVSFYIGDKTIRSLISNQLASSVETNTIAERVIHSASDVEQVAVLQTSSIETSSILALSELEKLRAFHDRLLHTTDVRYSLQLLTAPRSEMSQTLLEIQSLSDIDPEQVFYAIHANRGRFTLFYGLFSGYSSARAALAIFPMSILHSQPFVIPRQDVLKDLQTSIRSLEREPD